jgi:hypothetical protein
LLLSANPDLRWDEVKEILKVTADRIGTGYDAGGHSDIFGYGRVNAYNAVREAQNRRSGPGPIPSSSAPGITGPSTYSRSASAPQFDIDPGENTYYAVEVAKKP